VNLGGFQLTGRRRAWLALDKAAKIAWAFFPKRGMSISAESMGAALGFPSSRFSTDKTDNPGHANTPGKVLVKGDHHQFCLALGMPNSLFLLHGHQAIK
jgi:hypothetical protein